MQSGQRQGALFIQSKTEPSKYQTLTSEHNLNHDINKLMSMTKNKPGKEVLKTLDDMTDKG